MSATSVLGVVSSPRPQGRTYAAVEAVLAGAARAGADTMQLTVAADGRERILAAIEDADGIVFGSPVYRASFAADLKLLLEQLQRGRHGDTAAPLQGKAAAVVMTGASHHHFLSIGALRDVLCSFFAVQVLSPGLYLAHDAFDSDALASAAAEEAARHGAALHDLTAAVRSSAALAQLQPQV